MTSAGFELEIPWTQSGASYHNGGGWWSRVFSIMKNLEGTETPPLSRHSNSSLARNKETTLTNRADLRGMI
jgi:hypothetical protein